MTLFEVKQPPTIGDQKVTNWFGFFLGPQGFISSGDFWIGLDLDLVTVFTTIVAVVGLMSGGVVER